MTDLTAAYPESYGVPMASGRECPVPLQLRKFNYMYFLGTADLEEIQSEVLKSGYTALDSERYNEFFKLKLVIQQELPPGKGVVGVYIVDYLKTDIDPYQELVIYYAIEDPLNDKKPRMYVSKIRVSSDVSIEAGRKIWGFPKYLVKISFNAVQGNAVLIEKGKTAVSGSIDVGADFLELPLQENREYRLATGVDIRPTLSSVRSNVTVRVRTFGTTDKLAFDPESDLGRTLTDIEFEPRIVQTGKDVEAVLLEPGRIAVK